MNSACAPISARKSPYKALHVLDIPDDYQFMEDELIDLLREKCEPLIFGQA
jgi:predicted protein tyrosine phosphatase